MREKTAVSITEIHRFICPVVMAVKTPFFGCFGQVIVASSSDATNFVNQNTYQCKQPSRRYPSSCFQD